MLDDVKLWVLLFFALFVSLIQCTMYSVCVVHFSVVFFFFSVDVFGTIEYNLCGELYAWPPLIVHNILMRNDSFVNFVRFYFHLHYHFHTFYNYWQLRSSCGYIYHMSSQWQTTVKYVRLKSWTHEREISMKQSHFLFVIFRLFVAYQQCRVLKSWRFYFYMNIHNKMHFKCLLVVFCVSFFSLFRSFFNYEYALWMQMC